MQRRIVAFLALTAVLVLSRPASAVDRGRGLVPDSTAVTAVMLPLANHTGHGAARDLIVPALARELAERGVRVIESRDLRPLLRRHRIRTRVGVSELEARIIGRETGADFLVLGSLDVYRADGNPEIGFSLRLLDLKYMKLVGAISVGATGADRAPMFGRDRARPLAALLEMTVPQAIDAIDPSCVDRSVHWPVLNCMRLALVPLDNFSSTAGAGAIVSNILLSRLVDEGYFVVEPGFIADLMARLGRVDRGAVATGTATLIAETWGVCQIITGVVDRMAPGAGDPAVASPSLGLGLRVIDPRNGTLVRMWEIEGEGADSEHFLGLGRQHSLENLAVDAVLDIEKRLLRSP